MRTLRPPAFRRFIPAGAALLLAAVMSLPKAQAQVQLVTEDEARLPDATNLLTRAITRGPAVRLASPAEVPAQSFPLEIRLEARGGGRLDPTSLRVEYLKNPVVDVTARISGLVRDGVITAPAVRLPAGLHRFRVSVTDSEGRAGNAVLEIRAR